jgi:uncharacterized protein (TIGR00251 family)
MPAWYHWDGSDLLLQVQLQPRSREDGIVGLHGGYLKIKLTAPPVDGKANAYLCGYLADLCNVNKSQVKIESGDHSRIKRVRIQLNTPSLPTALMKF